MKLSRQAKGIGFATSLIAIAFLIAALLSLARYHTADERDATTPLEDQMREQPPVLGSAREAKSSIAREAISPSALEHSPDDSSRPSQPATVADEVDVEGVVIVTDPAGRQHPAENGAFVLRFWNDNGSNKTARTVQVRQGQWRARMRPDTPYAIDDPVLGDQWTVITTEGPFAVRDHERITVAASWPPSTVLRILDATTSNDLAGVTVLDCRDDYPARAPFELGQERVVARNASSPIVLHEQGSSSDAPAGRLLWVQAPSYASAKVSVDYARGGEHRVFLQTSAELEVIIDDPDHRLESTGDRAPSRLVVSKLDMEDLVAEASKRALKLGSEAPTENEIRQRLEESWQSFDYLGVSPSTFMVVTPTVDRATLLRDLSPGWFVVTIDRDGERAVAATVVELVQGQRARAVLEVRAPAKPKRVPLAGTLFIHPDWHVSGVNLTFMGEGMMRVVPFARMQAAEPGLFTWDAGLVLPGDYEVTLSRVGRTVPVEVGAEGCRDLRLVIPEPVTVRVRLVGDQGVLDAAAHTVAWNLDGDGGQGHAKWSSATGAFEFIAPLEPIWIEVTRGDRPSHAIRQLAALHAGVNDITVTLGPPMGARVWLLAGQPAAPIDQESVWSACWGVRVRGGGPDARAERPRAVDIDESGGLLIDVAVAGCYEIILPKLPGLERAPPFTIDVPDGKYVERRIILERERAR